MEMVFHQVSFCIYLLSLDHDPPDSGRGTFTTEHTGTGTSKSRRSEVYEGNYQSISQYEQLHAVNVCDDYQH